MSDNDDRSKLRKSRHLRNLARIISLPIIGFTMVIFIGHLVFPDTEPGSYPPIENLLPVLMTMSVLGLALAWRWELAGGVISIGFFILHLAVFWIIRGSFFPLRMLLVFSPIVIDAILFIMRARRHQISL